MLTTPRLYAQNLSDCLQGNLKQGFDCAFSGGLFTSGGQERQMHLGIIRKSQETKRIWEGIVSQKALSKLTECQIQLVLIGHFLNMPLQGRIQSDCS